MSSSGAMTPSHRYSPEEVRARLAKLGKWFHNINLNGVWTAPEHFLGDYPALKWREFERSIPADLRGKSVLDIGCNGGFYSIEMKRRGAGRVVAIDSDEDYLAQARFAAEVTGAEIEFHRMSVYDVARIGEQFDVVLFMGVIYHLRYPMLALDLVREHVARDLLVFQSLLRGSTLVHRLQQDYPFEETSVFDQPGFPRLHFIEDQYAGDPTNWWIPNLACTEAMLRSAGFRIVEHPEVEVFVCKAAQRTFDGEDRDFMLRCGRG